MLDVKMVRMLALSSVVREHQEYKDVLNASNDGA